MIKFRERVQSVLKEYGNDGLPSSYDMWRTEPPEEGPDYSDRLEDGYAIRSFNTWDDPAEDGTIEKIDYKLYVAQDEKTGEFYTTEDCYNEDNVKVAWYTREEADNVINEIKKTAPGALLEPVIVYALDVSRGECVEEDGIDAYLDKFDFEEEDAYSRADDYYDSRDDY